MSLSSAPSSLPSSPPPPSAPRPPLRRHDAAISADEPVGRRRWTLANVMTDEGISDEGLVRELERMREVGEWARRRERERRMSRAVNEGKGRGESGDGNEEREVNLEREEQDEMMVVWDMGREVWEREMGIAGEGAVIHDSPLSETGLAGEGDRKADAFPLRSSSTGPSITAPTTLPSSSWLAAQRALLTCRELILTERHYLSLLLSLVAQHTATPPPPLMLHYAEELVRASAAVLAGMEKEPSVGGVARAFLEREEEVGSAYIGWCGAVGAWFVDGAGLDDQGQGHLKKKRSRTEYQSQSGDGDADDLNSNATGPPVSPLKRTVSTWRRSMPSITSLGLDGGSMSIYGRREREVEKERVRVPSGVATSAASASGTGTGYAAVAPVSVPTVSHLVSASASTSVSGIGFPTSATLSGGTVSAGGVTARLGSTGNPKPPRKPAVRELAILPTQRVMRYVLLYRDLLNHTPSTSSSHALVERAVQAACRIADKCDRAQGNAAFIVSGTAGPGPVSATTPAKNRSAGKDANANAGGNSASSSRSSSRREVPQLMNRTPSSRPSSPSGKTASSASTSGSASTGATSVSGSASSSEGDPLAKSASSGTKAPTAFPTSSSSSHGSPAVLKKPQRRRPSTAGSTTTATPSGRRLSGVSLMTMSGIGWPAGKKASAGAGSEAVPMVVNVGAAAAAGGAGTSNLKSHVHGDAGAPQVVRSSTVAEIAPKPVETAAPAIAVSTAV
ncbi:hypothetical protein GALMADRAFT_386901 [Galerina marginata CBS 339.88]|uniref:DH domain-containing protein n=1 Tax=Galerina marginata (strain CBS 339.88) TaxID=685588 RepID=A0A067U0G3_GALM3|nr:hypothetical protein GALMADRAFT_386901 [Galerina marginata CBS 339.88]